jgi:cobalt-zinc-cadmium efflux system protein
MSEHHSHDHTGHDRSSHDHPTHDHHDHEDHHGHNDSHHQQNTNARLLGWSLALTLVFMVVESVSGWLANSLALLADAGHMFTDAAALALALAATVFAKRAPDSKRSFGYHRLQVLATFINGMALLLIVGWIAMEAIQKLLNPTAVNAPLMIVVATLGAAVNLGVFLLLKFGSKNRDGHHHDHDHHHAEDMNIAAATLHVLGDLLGSIGAVIAGVVIWYTNWTPIDPLLSVLLCVLIVRSAWALVRKSTHILLEGAPDWLDVDKLRSTLQAEVPAIVDVHHVHCWSLSPRENLLTLHATVNSSANPNGDHQSILAQIQSVLAEHFGITHATIQLEYGPCVDADCK